MRTHKKAPRRKTPFTSWKEFPERPVLSRNQLMLRKIVLLVVLVVRSAPVLKDRNQLIGRTLPREGSGYYNKLGMDAAWGTYENYFHSKRGGTYKYKCINQGTSSA